MSDREDIDAIKVYFDQNAPQNDQARVIQAKFYDWYNSTWRGLDAVNTAKGYRDEYNTANLSPPPIDNAADLTPDQKAKAAAAILDSDNLTHEQKEAFKGQNPDAVVAAQSFTKPWYEKLGISKGVVEFALIVVAGFTGLTVLVGVNSASKEFVRKRM